jgi:hypothetical protein
LEAAAAPAECSMATEFCVDREGRPTAQHWCRQGVTSRQGRKDIIEIREATWLSTL